MCVTNAEINSFTNYTVNQGPRTQHYCCMPKYRMQDNTVTFHVQTEDSLRRNGAVRSRYTSDGAIDGNTSLGVAEAGAG